MKLRLLLPLLLSGCATTYRYEDGTKATEWHWEQSALMLFIFIVLPVLLWRRYTTLPKGYTWILTPGDGSFGERFRLDIYAPNGDQLPQGWGRVTGSFVPFMKMVASYQARYHRKMGTL